MNLFNRKTLKRHIKADPIPSDHLAAVEYWAKSISSGRMGRVVNFYPEATRLAA